MRSRTALLPATLALMLGSSLARADVMFSGNTNGSTPTTINTYLTFSGATFSNVSVPPGAGPTALSNLGYFTLTRCTGNNCQEDFGTQDSDTDFTLKITFTDPSVTGTPESFSADVYGKITRAGNSNDIKNGSITINFDNAVQHLTYTTATGSGTVDLSVNDPNGFDSCNNFGDTTTVTGQLANLTFTPNSGGNDAPGVPEPGSVVLFGTALMLAGLSIRRKSRN